MKRWLFLVLRVLVAVAGLAFIALTLTWRDSVALPAGFPLPGGEQLAKATSAAIDRDRLDEHGQPVGELLLLVPHGDSKISVALPASKLGAAADQPRFKPGIVTTLTHADYRLLGLGAVMIGIMFPIQAYRWLLLLRCRGLDVGYRKAFRLTMVGQFFNFCMPGMTGGDVAKAYYAAKNSENRGAAVMSVIFDRVAGLVALIMLAGLVGLTMLDNPLVQRITLLVWLGMAGVVICAGLYFSKKVRRALKIDAIIARLPGKKLFQKVDAAANAYGNHKLTVLNATLVSLPVHLLNAGATAAAGYALGMNHPLPLLLTVIPILLLAGAVPLTYQGLGVMEGIAMAMLLEPGLATTNQIVGMLLLLRLYLVLWALVGSVELLRGDVALFPNIPTEEPPLDVTPRLEGPVA